MKLSKRWCVQVILLSKFIPQHISIKHIQVRRLISLNEKTYEWKKDVLDKGTLMHIYFKELGVVKYQRDELYGAMDVIGKSRFCR